MKLLNHFKWSKWESIGEQLDSFTKKRYEVLKSTKLWFLERISAMSSEITFGSEERKLHPADFEKLIKSGILQRTHNLEMIDCELCNEPHETAVRNEKDKLYYVCENGCGRKDLTDEDVAIFKYDAPRLLSLFQRAIGIDTPQVTAIADNVLWDLGEQSIHHSTYQIFFSRNLKELSDETVQMIAANRHPAIFYTGPSRNILPPHILTVSLVSCIQDIKADSVTANHEVLEQHFP